MSSTTSLSPACTFSIDQRAGIMPGVQTAARQIDHDAGCRLLACQCLTLISSLRCDLCMVQTMVAFIPMYLANTWTWLQRAVTRRCAWHAKPWHWEATSESPRRYRDGLHTQAGVQICNSQFADTRSGNVCLSWTFLSQSKACSFQSSCKCCAISCSGPKNASRERSNHQGWSHTCLYCKDALARSACASKSACTPPAGIWI